MAFRTSKLFAAGVILFTNNVLAAKDEACVNVAECRHEDDSTGLLQSKAASKTVVMEEQRQRQAGEVWEQLKAAVLLERLQQALGQAKDTEIVQHLQEQVRRLREAFPSVDEVKEQYSEQLAATWDLVRLAVNTENLKRKLADAAAAARAQGGDAGDFQARITILQAQLSALHVEDLQAQASANWVALQEAGVPLPALSVVAHAKQVVDQIQDATSDYTHALGDIAIEQAQRAYAQAETAVVDALDKADIHNVNDVVDRVQDGVTDAWQSDEVQNAIEQAHSAATDALNSDQVQHAVGQAQDAAQLAQDVAQNAWNSGSTYASVHNFIR